MTLMGTGFTGTTSVAVGGLNVNFQVIDDNTIVLTVPFGLVGAADIVVTSAGGNAQISLQIIESIPTLSTWGLLALLIALGGAGFFFLRPKLTSSFAE